jgi:small conductance mechanosensitive channel
MPHTPATLYPALIAAGRIVAILAAALVLSRISGRSIRRLRGRFLARMSRHAREASQEMEQRAVTVSAILARTAAIAIWSGAIMMALREGGFDVRPLVAGAGIAGVALSIGTQSLLRDVSAGLSMLVDNQVRIADVAIIDGTEGAVEEINLRTTVLRGWDGTVHVFHNGAIRTLSNMTREHAYALAGVRVAHREDPDRVAEALRQVGDELRADKAYAPGVLAPLEVLGVDQFIDGGYVIEARLKTRPASRWTVGREMNRRIKKRFDELGIAMR